MALPLACACGARFEVEDTFAGQDIRCPECQQTLKAPARYRGRLRTSDYALASFVLVLAGAFTVVGTAAGAVLGVVALVHIARNRGRVAGAGYAVFGIVAGCLFTALGLFAYVRADLIGLGNWMHRQAFAGPIRTDGPREVVNPAERFRVTRPSDRWGEVDPDDAEDLIISEIVKDSKLLLVHVTKPGYVDVAVFQPGLISLNECRTALVDHYSGKAWDPVFGGRAGLLSFQQCKVLESQRLPDQGRFEGMELLLETRFGAKPLTFLIRLYKDKHGPTLYVVRGWAPKRGFGALRSDLAEAVGSFRVLDR